MADELNNIKFRDIIAAPLTAIIDAGVMAAKATNDFIKTIGFHEPKDKTGDELGELRKVTFSYTRNTLDNVPAQFQIEVPLLSIMPIPCIEVKSAEIEFAVNLVNIENSPREVNLDDPDSVRGIQKFYPKEASSILSLNNPNTATRLSPASRKVQLEKLIERNATLSTGKSLTVSVARTEKTNNEVSSNYDMKIKIQVGQSDIPVGLARMFTIMEESILEEKR
jgi:hypothetical protein